jgi:hypothetical protein
MQVQALYNFDPFALLLTPVDIAYPLCMKFQYLDVWAFDNTARRSTVRSVLDSAWGIDSCSAFSTRILMAVSSVYWVWMAGIILGNN